MEQEQPFVIPAWLPRYTRKGRTKSERPLCNLCGLEDGACICRHLPPPKP